MGMDNNAVVYRNAIRTCSAPFVPYVGQHMKDLIFISDGNPDMKNADQINYTKFYSLWENVCDLLQGSERSYTILPSSGMHAWFMSKAPTLDEKQIYVWSKRYC